MGDNQSPAPEREMKNFQFRQMKKIRIFESPNELPKDRVNLLALSNIYGLVFMGWKSGLKIINSQYVALADKNEGNINAIIEDAPLMSVSMKLPVHHIALSCDDFTLSVAMTSEEYGLVIAFFDVRTFLNKEKQQKRPFVYYKPETKCTVMDLKWNPAVNSILAVCQSDGSLTILEVTDIIKQHASLPPTAGITSLCWSPKGKQLAAGRQNGTVVQYSPVLQEKKVIPCPPMYTSDNPVKVLDICWISTYVFAVTYMAADGSLESPPELLIISLAKKDEKREDQFLNFNDLCFGVSTERQHHYYLQYLENWDLILASSAASIEVSIVARQPDKASWELWVLEDAARAEFPVTENSDDTMPVGVGVDLTNQQSVTIGSEKVFPPCPILMLLSTDGVLCPFYMLNSIPGVKTGMKPPRCPRLEGEREPKPAQTSIPASSLLVPSRAATVSPQDSAVAIHPPPSFRPTVLPVILPALPPFQRGPVQSPPLKSPASSEGRIESGSSTDSQLVGAPMGSRLSPATSAKFVRFLEAGTTSASETESAVEAEQQAHPGEVRSSHPVDARSLLGSTAAFPVPKTCPTQTSASLELSVSDLEKQLQQYPTLDPVMVGIMEEIALFQKELDDLKARTARSNFEVGSAKEMSHLRYDAQSLQTFLFEIKEITETLHEEIGILKTVMLEGFAAVEDATTHNERSIDKNYLQLLRRKPLDPKSEAQLKEIRHLHQYVKFAVQDVNDVLDMEWEQHQEKNKKHKHLLLPEREVLFNALSSHHEIITQQDKKIDELINSLQNLRIYNQTSKWCVPNDKCLQNDQCWDTELEMLRNVLVKTTLDGAPKVTSPTPGKLSPVKQSQLRNFLSKRQTPPVRSTAPANLSRSAFISPKCFGELEDMSHISASLRLDHEGLQAEEQETAPSFKHAPITRLPSFPPALITAHSTPYGKPQPAGAPIPSTVPKSTGKMVKHGVPAAEKPATSLPAAQAAAQAAFRRQMTSQTAVPSAALTEPEQKEAAPPIGAQFLKDTGSSQNLLTVCPSVSTSDAEIGSQIKPGPLKGLPTLGLTATGSTLSESSSSSVSSFAFPPPTGSVLKSDLPAAGALGEQLHKISSYPGASTGFRFTPPSTSSLSALSTKAQGFPGSAKDATRTSFGLSNKASFGLGADASFSYKGPRSSSSSAFASESVTTAGSVCPSNTSCTELQPPGKPSATGAPPEPAIPAAASKTEDQQPRSEHQPAKPETRTSTAEIYPSKAEIPPQPKAEIPPQPKAEAPPQPKAEAPPQPKAEAPPQPKAEAPPQPKAEAPPQPKAEAPPQPKAEAPPQPKAEAPPQPKAEAPPQPKAEAPPQPKAEAPPQPKAEAPPQPKAEAPPQPKAEAPPQPKAEAPPQPKAEAPPQPKAEAPPQPKAEAPPQPKAEAPPQPKAEAPPQPKAEAPPQPKAEAPPQPKAEAPPQDETGVFESSARGVTIGSFSGLVVSQTDDATKLDRSSQDSFTFAQTAKTSTAPPTSLAFGSAFPLGKSGSTGITSASIDTGAPKPTGVPFPIISRASTETSISSSSLQSRASKLDFVSKQEQTANAEQIAAAIAAVSALQDSSLAGSLTSITSSIADAVKPSTAEEKKAVVSSSSSASSVTEEQAAAQGSKVLVSRSSEGSAGISSATPTSPGTPVIPRVIINSPVPSITGSSVATEIPFPYSVSLSNIMPSGSSIISSVSPFGASQTHVQSSPSQSESTTSLFSHAVVTSAPPAFGQPATTTSPSTLGRGTNGITSPPVVDIPSSAGSLAKPTFGQTVDTGFGQQSSSNGFSFRQPVFGSTSSFAQPTSAAAPMPSGSPFSGPTITVNANAFPFGQSPASNASMFGQPTTPAFGQSTGFGHGPAFGSNITTSSGFNFAQPSTGFSGSSASSVFGQSTNVSSMFGQPGSTASIFGSPATTGGFFSGLGRKPSLDAGARNPFGQMSFGSTEAANAQNLFGNSGAKTFGYGNASFGSDQKSTGSFSAGSSVAAQGFGSFSTPTKPPGGFGAAPVFGSPPGFGSTPTFGGSPAFGGPPAFSGSMSPSGGKVFGEGTAAASAGGFGFGNTANAQTFASVANQHSTGAFGSATQQTPGFGGQGTNFSTFGASGGGFGSGFGSTHQ
ncbi:nuclear pore complex protein Nup214 [Carcharodon carcharias]|uniref:nuclear pore complex protein Nup214 n=1 Tax=Carcharodon carcharias TaxID=13397 RepID=UPI001B7EF145|nr:nuclear pore complex protein Nup214 [Carcharodon carcharias]